MQPLIVHSRASIDAANSAPIAVRAVDMTKASRATISEATEARASTHVLAAVSVRSIGLMTVFNQTDLT